MVTAAHDMTDTQIHRWVALAQRGEHPRLIAHLASGWVVAGEQQVVRGYCLLLPDPVGVHLNALTPTHQARFLYDMAALGDVLLEVTGAARINYEMLGNLEPALHAHLFPRYDSEPADLRTRPIWYSGWAQAPLFDTSTDAAWVRPVAEGLQARGLVV